MKKDHVLVFAVLFAFCLAYSSCDSFNATSLYPYIEYDVDYIGYKPGLTTSSSNQEFARGLYDVLQAYLANNSSSSKFFRFYDGVNYEITNIQEAIGGIPNTVWTCYWEKLDKYSYDLEVGSCYMFVYLEIPSRGVAGTAYVLYTIVTNTARLEVYPYSYRAILNPR